MSRWNERDDVKRGADYDARWQELVNAGQTVHGEADLIGHLIAECFVTDVRTPEADPGGRASVLDAGCGTGRVAIELFARGFDVAGVDLDAAMLDEARAKAPAHQWVLGDLIDVDLEREFDFVLMAGNVMIFVAPDTEAEVVANLARHARPGGLLVAGFMTGGGRLEVHDYDRFAEAAGLELVARWSTWDREPFAGGDYAVSVHRRR